MADWRPIETVPRDGSDFLAYYPEADGDGAFMEVVSWFETPKELNAGPWTRGGVDPTHWRPLPPGPHDRTEPKP